jgi:hypothetical protein
MKGTSRLAARLPAICVVVGCGAIASAWASQQGVLEEVWPATATMAWAWTSEQLPGNPTDSSRSPLLRLWTLDLHRGPREATWREQKLPQGLVAFERSAAQEGLTRPAAYASAHALYLPWIKPDGGERLTILTTKCLAGLSCTTVSAVSSANSLAAVSAVAGVGDGRLWALFTGDAGAGHRPERLGFTIDGGHTWQFVDNDAILSGILGGNVPKLLIARSTHELWLGTITFAGGTPALVIARTKDDGRTWTLMHPFSQLYPGCADCTLAGFAGKVPASRSPGRPSDCLDAVVNRPNVDAQKTWMIRYCSTDDGNTWTLSRVPWPSDDNSQRSRFVAPVYASDSLGWTTQVVSDREYQTFQTTTGGQTWNPISDDLHRFIHDRLIIKDARREGRSLWVLYGSTDSDVNNALLYSSDRGAHWSAVRDDFEK